MVAIEDNGTITFTEGEKVLTLEEGFTRLDRLYPYESFEGKKIIENLKKKYLYRRDR